MEFPISYNCLNQNEFSEGEFKIVPLRYEDRMSIMKWRNEQIYHLRQVEELTADSQESYFRNTVASLFKKEKPSQILFSYLKNDTCIGYGGLVHINWIDKNAEISFIMNTELEEKNFYFHWTMYLYMIEKVAFNELSLHKINTYAYDLRPNLYRVLEDFGYEKEINSNLVLNGKSLKIITHTKHNKNLYESNNEKY